MGRCMWFTSTSTYHNLMEMLLASYKLKKKTWSTPKQFNNGRCTTSMCVQSFCCIHIQWKLYEELITKTRYPLLRLSLIRHTITRCAPQPKRYCNLILIIKKDVKHKCPTPQLEQINEKFHQFKKVIKLNTEWQLELHSIPPYTPAGD